MNGDHHVSQRGPLLFALGLLLATQGAAGGKPDAEPANVLEIVRVKDHLALRTGLPPGKHPFADALPAGGPSVEGFVYTTPVGDNSSVVRIFQLRASLESDVARRIRVRMRASTTPGYYTLSFEVLDQDGKTRVAILRRHCCGYQLELNGDPFAGNTYQAINLTSLERDHSEAFAEFVSIVRACNLPGIHVAPDCDAEEATVAKSHPSSGR